MDREQAELAERVREGAGGGNVQQVVPVNVKQPEKKIPEEVEEEEEEEEEEQGAGGGVPPVIKKVSTTDVVVIKGKQPPPEVVVKTVATVDVGIEGGEQPPPEAVVQKVPTVAVVIGAEGQPPPEAGAGGGGDAPGSPGTQFNGGNGCWIGGGGGGGYYGGGGGGWAANGGNGTSGNTLRQVGAVGGYAIVTNGNSVPSPTGSGTVWGTTYTSSTSVVYTFPSTSNYQTLNLDTIPGIAAGMDVILVVPANVILYSSFYLNAALKITYSTYTPNSVRIIVNGAIMVKFAVTVLLEFMVMVTGLVVPDASPDQLLKV